MVPVGDLFKSFLGSLLRSTHLILLKKIFFLDTSCYRVAPLLTLVTHGYACVGSSGRVPLLGSVSAILLCLLIYVRRGIISYFLSYINMYTYIELHDGGELALGLRLTNSYREGREETKRVAY